MKVNEDDVAAACEALLARGETPTVRRVRAEIGRGSPGDLAPMIKDWKLGHEEAMALEAVPVPDAVARQAAQFAGKTWLAAQEAAAGTVALRDAELAQVREQGEAERQDLMEVIVQLEGERDAALSDAKRARSQAGKAEKEAAALQAEVVRLEERVAGRDREVERCEAMAAAAEAREAAMRAELAALRERTAGDEVMSEVRHAAE